jgi:hypothetical protein
MGYYESGAWAHFPSGPLANILLVHSFFVPYVTHCPAPRNLASGKMLQSLHLKSQSKNDHFQ